MRKLRAIKPTLLSLLIAVAGGCIGTPKQASPAFYQAMDAWRLAESFAKEHGLAYSLNVNFGPPSAGQKTEFFLNVGIDGNLHVQGNAAANREPAASSETTCQTGFTSTPVPVTP